MYLQWCTRKFSKYLLFWYLHVADTLAYMMVCSYSEYLCDRFKSVSECVHSFISLKPIANVTVLFISQKLYGCF